MKLMLDFDGVLHPAFVYLKDGKPTLSADGELFMWAPLLEKAIAPYPRLEIILSTSWVQVKGFDYARNALPESIQKRVTGATWHSAVDSSPYASQTSALSGWVQMSRYEQICLYVNRVGIENWISIDDDHVGWAEEERQRLIRTDPELGISEIAVFKQLQSALLELSLLG